MAINITPTEQERIDEAFEELSSKWPARYAIKGTVFLKALMESLATGDGYIKAQVEAVRDNLVSVTASGKHLDRRAGLYGVVRGQGTGVFDEDFRKIIPVLGMSPKQITHTLQKLIDIVYGPLASHANTTCSSPEPYALEDGFNLIVRRDDSQEEIVFTPTDAITLSAATADEVATAISKKTSGRLIGSVVANVRTGEKFVNIRTRTIGSQGFIQVLGGDAQSKFQFPEVRPVSTTLATYDVTRFGGSSEMVYTVTAGVPPDLKAAGVKRGDFVTIREDSGFDSKNVGTFIVTSVGATSFRVDSSEGLPESGVVQSNLDDFTFYKPDLGNVLLSARPATIMEINPGEIVVILPVTSPLVKRSLRGGHHFHQGLSEVISTTSSTIELGSSVGFLSTGGRVHPTLSRKSSKGIVSTISATTVTLIDSQNWPTKGSFWSPNTNIFYFYEGIVGDTLQAVTPTPDPELPGANVKYIEYFKYTAISGNTLTGVFPDPTGIESQEVVAAGANISDLTQENFKGGFLYDPDARFTNSENVTTIIEVIDEGDVKTLLQVGDVSNFDDEGQFVLEFGTSNEEGPIRYLSKVGTGALIIDPSHVFEKEHIDGISIRMIRQLGPYTPRVNGQDLAVYITSTSPARDLLATYLRLVAASGVLFRFEIRIPPQKWEVLPNLFTTNPLDLELVTI